MESKAKIFSESTLHTLYKIYKNLKNTSKIIDEKLFYYNKECVPATQEPESIDLHYIVKEKNFYCWHLCKHLHLEGHVS